jgi:hypothetical protein
MAEVGLQRERVSWPSLASLYPQACRSMWACALIPSLAAIAARSTIREKPGAVRGGPRSETNMKGEPTLSR